MNRLHVEPPDILVLADVVALTPRDRLLGIACLHQRGQDMDVTLPGYVNLLKFNHGPTTDMT